MVSELELQEYMAEIRQQVCTRCIDRPPHGPPCAPLGKRCGIELNLAALVDAMHEVDAPTIDPYIDRMHDEVCPNCANQLTSQCPCPLDYLLTLAVRAIETVDERRAAR